MIICSLTDVLADRYNEETALEMLKSAGFDAADLSLFSMEENPRWSAENYREEAKRRGASAAEKGIPTLQSHAPYAFDKNRDFEKEVFPLIWRSVEIAALAGARAIVVHGIHNIPYFGNEELLFETNMAFYRRFIPLCEKYGIRVCVENMWRPNPRRKMIDHSICSRPEEFNRYVDALQAESGYFHACLDLGHTVLVGEDPAEMVLGLNSRIAALHIHANNYHDDSHPLPACGKIDVIPTFEALGKIGFRGPFTLEADDFFSHQPEALWPLSLRYMAEVSRYYSGIIEDHYEA